MNFAPYCVEDLGTLELAIVSPETTLIDCAKKMHDLRVSSLIVASTSDGSAGPWLPQGILTDRDIVLEAVAFSLDPGVITAGDIMTCPLVTARLDEALQVVHERMQFSEITSIVIVDAQGALVGMLEADRVSSVLRARGSGTGPQA